MKKLISLLLVSVLLLSLTACGGPAAACKKLLGDTVNLDNYDKPDVSSGTVYYRHSNDSTVTLDYTVHLKACNSAISMPVTTYQDLLDAGWNGNMPGTAEGRHTYTSTIKAPNGAFLSVTVFNPSEEDVPSNTAIVTGVTCSPANAGGFSIGSINEGSSVADVIAAYGEPALISYSESASGLNLVYEDDMDGTLQFTFDAAGVLTDMKYYYSEYNLV